MHSCGNGLQWDAGGEDVPDWISITEAAALSGYNAAYLRRLIRNGKIAAERKGPMWWVDRKSLTAYLRMAQRQEDKRHGPKRQGS